MQQILQTKKYANEDEVALVARAASACRLADNLSRPNLCNSNNKDPEIVARFSMDCSRAFRQQT